MTRAGAQDGRNPKGARPPGAEVSLARSPVFWILLVVGAVVVGGYALRMFGGDVKEIDPRKKQSMDNMRRLIAKMLLPVTEEGLSGWPAYDGKGFVLSQVATGRIDRRHPDNLEILFSPADPERSVPRVRPHRWAEITTAALEARRSFDECTSYAGRRNRDETYRISAREMRAGTPVIADLHFPDCALVGFSSGATREMSREELGLGPDDPIVAGRASRSRILRLLSSN
jgi:hypothetical protein